MASVTDETAVAPSCERCPPRPKPKAVEDEAEYDAAPVAAPAAAARSAPGDEGVVVLVLLRGLAGDDHDYSGIQNKSNQVTESASGSQTNGKVYFLSFAAAALSPPGKRRAESGRFEWHFSSFFS